jgi:hypothetical protein
VSKCKPSLLSLTYVPYYDSAVIHSKKNMLGEVQVHHDISAKVNAL